MELEEMQTVWSQMSDQVESQKILTNKLIMEMTQERYKNKIGILSKYESIAAVLCFVGAILILLHFKELDTWYLLASGIFAVMYLIFFPTIILRSIKSMKHINIINNTHKEALLAFTKKEKQFLLIQRASIFLNAILVVVILPVTVKVFNGKDIFKTNINLLLVYYIIIGILLLITSNWIYKTYKNLTKSASKILEELEDV